MRWYSYRWLIERYHFVLKSGCGLEKLQLETGRRIEMALATYSIVAWRLLWLTYCLTIFYYSALLCCCDTLLINHLNFKMADICRFSESSEEVSSVTVHVRDSR